MTHASALTYLVVIIAKVGVIVNSTNINNDVALCKHVRISGSDDR